MRAGSTICSLVALIGVSAITCTIQLFLCDDSPWNSSTKLTPGNNSPSLDFGGDHDSTKLNSSEIPSNKYEQLLPPIFIGGVGNEGSSVLFSVLCALPNMWCINKFNIIFEMINFRFRSLYSLIEQKRLAEAGVTSEVLTSGLQAFLAEIMVETGREKYHLCINDIDMMMHMYDLPLAFPNARIVLVVQDGREQTSMFRGHSTPHGKFPTRRYHQSLNHWNSLSEILDRLCHQLNNQCQPIYYEQLVRQPEQMIRYLAKFLDLRPKDDDTLSLWVRNSAKLIPSKSWSDGFKYIPEEVYRNETKFAPMLRQLGFDVANFPPKNHNNNTKWLKF